MPELSALSPFTSAVTGLIFDVRRFSLQDGPGIRTTVFFKGCPLRCSWCHNPESLGRETELLLRPERCLACDTCQGRCPEHAQARRDDGTKPETACDHCATYADHCPAEARQVIGRSMQVDEVLATVERDRPFFDESGGGVTLSGGEPLAQPAFCAALLAACHQRDLHTALDTSAYAPWPVLDQLRHHVDLFLVDLKHCDDAAHRAHTGVSLIPIHHNLRRLAAGGHRLVLRLPLIPGVNDDDANLEASGRFAAELSGVERLSLLPFHRLGTGKRERLGHPDPHALTEPPTRARLESIAERLRAFGLLVTIGS